MFGSFDPLMLLFLIPPMILAFGAQAFLKYRVSTLSKIQNQAGMTGAECAKKILEQNGITDVKVEPVKGVLTDHYSPREKVLRLSPEIHDGKSVTSLGVAAHECGHALQDQKEYAPLVLRSTLAPLTAIGSKLGMWLCMLFVAIQAFGLLKIGIVIFSVSTVFSLVTLPVEFNASSRAMEQLVALKMTQGEETVQARKVLNAAALTYVAAAAASSAQLAYFIFRAHARR